MSGLREEIEAFAALPCEFSGFFEPERMSACGFELVCVRKIEANSEKNYVPAYFFEMRVGGKTVGRLDLRVGYSEGLYYGGNIGYVVFPPYRGRGYAGVACALLLPLAKKHGMKRLLITCDPTNHASARVCEKLGLRLLRRAQLPDWTELWRDGHREVLIYEWDINE